VICRHTFLKCARSVYTVRKKLLHHILLDLFNCKIRRNTVKNNIIHTLLALSMVMFLNNQIYYAQKVKDHMVNILKHPNAKTCNFQILELFISSTCALIPNIDSNICFIIFTQYIMKVAGVRNKNDKARDFFFSTEKLSILV
jgi:hypothetical protein